MIYMAGHTKEGLLIALGITDENLKRILADDPLMARLSLCGYPNGLFFIFAPPAEGGLSKRMGEIIGELNSLTIKMKICLCGLNAIELRELREGRFLSIEPTGEAMPGIFRITVFYCKDRNEMIRDLRKEGLITPETDIRIIPRHPEAN